MTNIGNWLLRFGFYLVIVSWLLVIPRSASSGELIGPAEDPIRIGVGARLMGMGKAFVALADDGSAIFTNPAGLSELESWYFLSMYSNLMNEIPYVTLSYSHPLKLQGIPLGLAVGYVGSGVADIISPTQAGFTYFDYHNTLILLSLAGRVNQSLSLGLNFKFFDEGYSGVVNASGRGSDMDLGLKYTISEQAALGITFQNFLPVSAGGRLTWDSGLYESIPCLLKMGGAFKFLDNRVRLAVDNDYWLTRELPMQLHAGVEWELHPILILRGGVDQSISSATARNVHSNLTLGVGLRLLGSRLDYAYHPYHEEQGNITHFFSFSFSPAIREKVIAPPPPTSETRAVTTPEVHIQEPPDKLITSRTEIIFRGTFEAIAMLTISGEKVRLRSDKSFEMTLPLEAGMNQFLISAADERDQVVEYKRTVYRRVRFTDLSPLYWAYHTIHNVAALGILKGYPDGSFRPKELITRKHALILLKRLGQQGLPREDYRYLSQKMLGQKINRAEVAAAIYRTEFFKKKFQELVRER
jgi:hypothetical protein